VGAEGHPDTNELLHVDVKKLGRIPDGGGHRFRGRVTATPRSHGGCDYLHVAIDDELAIRPVADPELSPPLSAPNASSPGSRETVWIGRSGKGSRPTGSFLAVVVAPLAV
jgi:hypothetical protein